MGFQPHYFMDIVFAVIGIASALVLALWSADVAPGRRSVVRVVLAASVLLVAATALLGTVRVARHFPANLVAWIRCAGIFIAVSLPYAVLLTAASRRSRAFSPARRRLLRTGVAAAVAVPAGLATFGIVRRNDLRPREVDVPLPRHAVGLDGLRIVQLTDIHLGNFVPASYLERAVAMANEFRPHIALVTGDLITTKGDPLDECLRTLRGLRADAGVFGCCGNHEIYADAENYVEREGARMGTRYLRSESVPLRFGNSVLQLAGVDYQRRGRPYLRGAQALQAPDRYNVLLSHNPDVFGVAAEQGWDLTIAGHTHGGQVHMEWLHPKLNLVRFTTPWVYGLYEQDGRRIYVSRGIGTIGVPVRLGAPPEVVCLRLCAT